MCGDYRRVFQRTIGGFERSKNPDNPTAYAAACRARRPARPGLRARELVRASAGKRPALRRHSLFIAIETPTDGRGGWSRMTVSPTGVGASAGRARSRRVRRWCSSRGWRQPLIRLSCHSAAHPLPLLGVSIRIERGCQQSDSLRQRLQVAHVSARSAVEAAELVEWARPEAVLLELCGERRELA